MDNACVLVTPTAAVHESSSLDLEQREGAADSYGAGDFAGTFAPDIAHLRNPVDRLEDFAGTISIHSLAVIESGSPCISSKCEYKDVAERLSRNNRVCTRTVLVHITEVKLI